MSLTVLFTGVGEAFDERRDNCSLLALAQGRQGTATVLLDCGFTAPFAFWRLAPALGLDPMALDAVWISHFHGDHFLGLPALLLRLAEDGRARPLVLVGLPGVGELAQAAMDMAYPGFMARLGFALEAVEVQEGGSLDLLGLDWGFAATGHGRPCLALRLAAGAQALYYSGDGPPTRACLALARGCGLVAHEAYGLEPDVLGHGSVPQAVDLARGAGAAVLALVHIGRRTRHGRAALLEQTMARAAGESPGLRVLAPEAGDIMEVPAGTCPRQARP